MGKIAVHKGTNHICAVANNDEILVLTQNGLRTETYIDPFKTTSNHFIVRNIDIPSDFEMFKYLYLDGQVVLNENFDQIILDRNAQELQDIADREEKDSKNA